jgi:hypothetical protein
VSRRLVLVLWGAALAGCAWPTRTAPHPSGLPPVPEYFASPLGPVPVVWKDSIPTERAGYVVLGRFRPLEREIWIWKGVTGRGEQWRVAAHEECHLRSWDRGLRFTDETVEAMCDLVAYAAVEAVLRSTVRRR